MVYRLLDAYEIVVWLDADAIVVDFERNIADELRPDKDLYLVEHRGALIDQAIPNTGVLMLHAGAWARELLSAVWACADLADHPWREQAALMRLLGYNIEPGNARPERRTYWHGRTQFLHTEWNNLPHLMPAATAVINHYAGQPFDERRCGMLHDLGQIAARTGLPLLSGLTAAEVSLSERWT